MFRFMRSLLQAERDFFNAGWKAMADFAPAMEQLDVKLAELEVAQGALIVTRDVCATVRL